MSTKMKSFFKGFKYISQIFVYKEHEMEIGYPTDVRHVAHIGWDSSPLNAPSWMNEFKTTSDFSTHSLNSCGQSRETSWASQDFDRVRAEPRATATARAIGAAASRAAPPSDIPKAPKKAKRKKAKQRSPSASSRSTTGSSRSRDSFATAVGEGDPIPVESG